MKMGELCNRDVVFAYRDDSLHDVARLMLEHHVGCLVVVDEVDSARVSVGLVTDRDLVVKGLAQGASPSTSVETIMSAPVVTAREHEEFEDVLKRMRSWGVRRIPVVDSQGHLQGIFTLDDVIETASERLDDVAELIAREQKREA